MCAWLHEGYWPQLAAHANRMSQQLGQVLAEHPAIELAWPVEANEVFAVMPLALFEQLKAAGVRLYDWSSNVRPKGMSVQPDALPVRLVTSFETQETEIQQLGQLLGSRVSGC